MGMTAVSAKYIKMIEKRYDLDFSSIATLGRQQWYYHDKDVFFHQMKKYFRLDTIIQDDGFTENFWFSLCGCKNVDSIDISDYEGANILLDLNEPIPQKYENKYMAVIDGGLLEHIFDFPSAIKNVMSMVSVGG